MSPLLAPVAVVLMLLLSAVTGPALVRRASPALARMPRGALAVLVLACVAWVLLLLSLGPLLAWSMSGPALALVPDGAADVCQRCLAAARPFNGAGVDTALPSALLVAGPLLVAAAVVARLARRWTAQLRLTRGVADELTQGARTQRIGRATVHVIASPAPVAFALPGRRGPIVVSTATMAALEEQELLAVVEHERAHRSQGHHAIGFLSRELAALLPFVPVLRVIADAVPHYLEIAADAAAVRHVGTSALAGALLRLGGSGIPPRGLAPAHELALHAAGPGRVQHLLAPSPARNGATAATGFGLGLGGSFATVLFIVGSYLAALVNGCS